MLTLSSEIFVRLWLDRAPDDTLYFIGFAILGFASIGLTVGAGA
jgi:hypothetical protein